MIFYYVSDSMVITPILPNNEYKVSIDFSTWISVRLLYIFGGSVLLLYFYVLFSFLFFLFILFSLISLAFLFHQNEENEYWRSDTDRAHCKFHNIRINKFVAKLTVCKHFFLLLLLGVCLIESLCCTINWTNDQYLVTNRFSRHSVCMSI